MGFGIWLEFISLGSSQFIARYLIRWDTPHWPANIHEILLRPLIGQVSSNSASYWPGLVVEDKVVCIKVAGGFSSGYCGASKSNQHIRFFIWYFLHFSNVFGQLSYPLEGSREAINFRGWQILQFSISDWNVVIWWKQVDSYKPIRSLRLQNWPIPDFCWGYRMIIIKLEDQDIDWFHQQASLFLSRYHITTDQSDSPPQTQIRNHPGLSFIA